MYKTHVKHVFFSFLNLCLRLGILNFLTKIFIFFWRRDVFALIHCRHLKKIYNGDTCNKQSIFQLTEEFSSDHCIFTELNVFFLRCKRHAEKVQHSLLQWNKTYFKCMARDVCCILLRCNFEILIFSPSRRL